MAEETAIALTQRRTPITILSDCQHSIRHYIKGRVPQVLKILPIPCALCALLVPMPAHTGIGANKAHKAHARALTFRTTAPLAPKHGTPEVEAPMPLLQFRDITLHHRLHRREYPGPHTPFPGGCLRAAPPTDSHLPTPNSTHTLTPPFPPPEQPQL